MLYTSDIYGVIYTIRNNINNKLYIGQTTRSFDERYANNLENKTDNSYLKNSIKKYGIENFKIDKEFDIAYSREEIDKLEDMYIKIYDTTNREKGYNRKFGGHHGRHTQETKDILSTMKKGWKLSQEHKNKLIRANTGSNSSQARKVICLTTGDVFNTISEASKSYDVGVSCICDCCSLKRVSTNSNRGNVKWSYFEEGKDINDYYVRNKLPRKPHKEETKKKIGDANRGKKRDPESNKRQSIKFLGDNNPRALPVRCITTNMCFGNIKDAGLYYGCDKGSIGACCRGKRKYTISKLLNGEKLKWEYI